MQGFLVSGECLGCKFEDRSFIDSKTGKQESFIDVKVGIRIPKFDGYDGETEVVSIGLSKKHIDSNLPELFSSLRGKIIVLSFYSRAFISKKGTAGVEYKLSGNGKPLED